jgi:hypothetical protein
MGNATVQHKRYTVNVYRILGTNLYKASVYEPLNGHSTLTYNTTDRPLGSVHTRPLPANLEALPAMSDIRSYRVRSRQARLRSLETAIVMRALNVSRAEALQLLD